MTASVSMIEWPGGPAGVQPEVITIRGAGSIH
jgi:hypothetical protein